MSPFLIVFWFDLEIKLVSRLDLLVISSETLVEIYLASLLTCLEFRLCVGD